MDERSERSEEKENWLVRGHRFALMSGAVLLLAATAVTLILGPPAQAEVRYPPPPTVASAGGEVRHVEAAVDRSGTATVVWHERNGSIDRIRVRRIGPEGEPVTASRTVRPGQSGDSISAPRIAITPDGVATVAWAIEREIQDDTVVQAQRVSAAGSLTGPRINVAGGDAAAESPASATESPGVAVDGRGHATVAWVEQGKEESRILARRLSASGGLGTSHPVSPPGEIARAPDLATAGASRALIVWLQGPQDRATVRLRRISTNGSPVSPARRVSDLGAVGVPSVAADPSGWAAVAWSQTSAFKPNVHLRRIAPNGSLGRDRDVTVDHSETIDPVIAVDAEGRSILTWVDSTTSQPLIQALRTGPDGTFGPVRTISTSSATRDPVVVVNDTGVPTLYWTARSGASEQVRASTGEIVGPFTALIGKPEQGSVVTEAEQAFDFRAIASDSLGTIADFECRLGTGEPFSCTPGEQIGPLANGPHVFAVRAVDIEGDWGPPASRGFRAIVTNLPSKLTVDRARIIGGHPANRRLAVIGSLDDRAAGRPVFFVYRTAAGQVRTRTRVNRQGRFRLVQPLRGGSARAEGGRLTVAFRGSRELRPGRAAIRVGPERLSMRLGQPRLASNRLSLAGQLGPGLSGPLRVQLELNRPNAAPAAIPLRGRANRRGVFRIDRRVPGWVSVAGGYVTVAHPGRGRFSGRVAGVTIEP